MTIISIPYGSIKRFAANLVVTVLLQISIPYGSIKSSNVTGQKLELHGFQFLMVRLKVICTRKSRAAGSYFNSLWFD